MRACIWSEANRLGKVLMITYKWMLVDQQLQDLRCSRHSCQKMNGN